MSLFLPFSRLLLLLLLACAPASALPLRVLAWDQEIAGRDLAVGTTEKSLKIGYMHPHSRTEPLHVPRENLRLEVRDRANAEGEVPLIPLKIPAGIRRPLLLLLPSKNAKTGLQTRILEDHDGTFRWGTIRLLNLTSRPLVFRWEKKGLLLPEKFQAVEVSPGGSRRNMEVMLYLKDNLKQPLYSAVWEHRDDLRQLVFVVPNPDPSSGPVAVKFVSEHQNDVPPASPE